MAPSYWVVAEIGELRINQRGHCYMDFVEKQENVLLAKIKANIWAYNFRKISHFFHTTTGKTLQPGMKILANVCINFHELYGISLVVQDIDPTYTMGERSRRRQQVIDQLQKEGVFGMNKTLKLPLVPQKVAIISSPTAAGLGDFLDQLQKNKDGYHFNLQLFSAMMQGDEASDSMVKALHQVFNRQHEFDLVAIVRGGGAQVDLDCFDVYDLASHVAQFPLPVITGIGHERDETIVDLVAHTSLKTPTAVSEFLVSGIRSFDERLNRAFQQLNSCSVKMLNSREKHLTQVSNQIRHYTNRRIQREHGRLERMQDVLQKAPFKLLAAQSNKVRFLEQSVKYLDPINVLKRGFTITKKKDVLLQYVDKIDHDDELTTITAENIVKSKVTEVNERR